MIGHPDATLHQPRWAGLVVAVVAVGGSMLCMLLLTIETLPADCRLLSLYPMIQITHQIEISAKDWVRSLTERPSDGYQEACDLLVASAPKEANAIIGIRVATSTQAFGNGTFLYLTYIGTPALIEGVR